MLLQQKNYDVILKTKKCARCKENIIEMFKMQIKNEPTFEMLLTDIIRDKNIKVEFDALKITCPACDEHMKDVTYFEFDKDDLELLNKTALKDVWMTIEDI